MKRAVVFGAMLAAVVLASCGSDKVADKEPEKPVYKSGRPELIDWKGQAVGSEVPNWVKAVADGDKAAVKKAMGVDNKQMLFVITKDGQNLDFLKTWADQIDVRNEVATSLETTIANTVQTELEAQQMDEETVQRKAKQYSAQATNMTLNGLQKLNDYWVKTRTLKTGVKEPQSDADYNFKTTYYAVFGIDSANYQKQLEKAMNDVDDNDEATSFLRGLLTQKCTEALLPDNAPSFEE